MHVLGIDAGGNERRRVCWRRRAVRSSRRRARPGQTCMAAGEPRRGQRCATSCTRERSAIATITPAAICHGIAGVDRDDEDGRSGPSCTPSVQALASSSSTMRWIALVASTRRAERDHRGTGSIAYGRNPAGATSARAGAGGAMVGDEVKAPLDRARGAVGRHAGRRSDAAARRRALTVEVLDALRDRLLDVSAPADDRLRPRAAARQRRRAINRMSSRGWLTTASRAGFDRGAKNWSPPPDRGDAPEMRGETATAGGGGAPGRKPCSVSVAN